ncbi:MAG: GntR family transcriptional regulator [Erythrobacter sp.]|nr:GntR family transcriptional regulator [Erythrobacter sp.]
MSGPFQRPKTIAEAAQDEIRSLIARGDLGPGDRANEVTLSRRLGVSRGSIREALRALERENLVEITANKGARVRALDAQEARDLYEIRIGLGVAAAAGIAANTDAAFIERLHTLIAIMDESAAAGDLLGFHEQNRRFHATLIGQSGNARLTALYMALFDEVYLLRAMNFLSRGSTARSQRGHRLIVAAIESRDADRVMAAIRDHIRGSRDFIISLFDAGENGSKAAIQL